MGARLVGIIGVPGDRLIRDMIEVGGICAGIFDKVYIKEDKDLRAAAGETAGYLMEGLIREGFPRKIWSWNTTKQRHCGRP